MIVFELVTWLVLGASLGALQAYLWPGRPWLQVLSGSLAAVLGGMLTRLSSVNLWLVGGYSISSLLVAGLFALAAVVLGVVTSRAPRAS